MKVQLGARNGAPRTITISKNCTLTREGDCIVERLGGVFAGICRANDPHTVRRLVGIPGGKALLDEADVARALAKSKKPGGRAATAGRRRASPMPAPPDFSHLLPNPQNGNDEDDGTGVPAVPDPGAAARAIIAAGAKARTPTGSGGRPPKGAAAAILAAGQKARGESR